MASETTIVAERALPMAHPLATPSAAARTSGRLARIEIIGEMAEAEPVWRALEADGVLSPYQRFDWIAAWQRHAGAACGLEPFVVVGWDRYSIPLFLLPLGYDPRARVRVGRFLGGKHANFNFGPWRRGVAFAPADVRGAVARLRALASGIDVLELTNQPQCWEGVANPLLALPHQASPSEGYRLALGGNGAEVLASAYSSSTRARLRTKERKLQAIPGYRYVRATTPAEVERFLAGFFAQKADRLAAQGIANVFAEPGVQGFLREACMCGLAAGNPVIELHALDSDAGVLAVFGGVNDGTRFSGMINSISRGEHMRHSPGLILLNHLVASCTERGLVMFDLGVGEAEYKAILCDGVEPLFDSLIPLSREGRLAAPLLALKSRAKRVIKRSPLLWQMVQKLRRMR
jgi:CelD/BcsL family acetyltransferase involved in cellulose biosynthesis